MVLSKLLFRILQNWLDYGKLIYYLIWLFELSNLGSLVQWCGLNSDPLELEFKETVGKGRFCKVKKAIGSYADVNAKNIRKNSVRGNKPVILKQTSLETFKKPRKSVRRL